MFRRWHAALVLAAAVLMFAPYRGGADGGFLSRAEVAPEEPHQSAVIVYQDGVEDLLLQVGYAGASGGFTWIVPTPGRPAPGACAPKVFERLDALVHPPAERRGRGRLGGGFGGVGGEDQVRVLSRERIGIHDVAVLDTSSASALLDWLRQNGFRVGGGAAPALDYYVRRHWFFTAARIDPGSAAGDEQPRNGAVQPAEAARRLPAAGELEPIRLSFPTAAPIYPLKISSINRGVTDLRLTLVTPRPTVTTGFSVEYRRPLTTDTLNGILEGRPAVNGPMWLTRLSRRLRAADMKADVEFPLQAQGAPLAFPRSGLFRR